MKILHLLWSFSTGGIETMLVDIVNEQVKYCEIHIIIINDLVNQEVLSRLDKNIKLTLINRPVGSKNILFLIKLNILVRKINPDVIHHHMQGTSNVIWNWNGISLRTIHNTNYPSDEWKKFAKLYSISKAVSDYTNNQGYSSTIVNNGIHCDIIKVKENHKFGDTIHFVQVGRLFVKQKGQDLLVGAANLLINKYNVRNIKIHFVGDGPDKQMLLKMVNQYQLQDFIKFDGLKERSWVYNHLCDFDCFIQPSRFEGFGLTVAEACAAKVPVIVSDIEGPIEIIDGGRLGITFKTENYGDLAKKMLSFTKNMVDINKVEDAYIHMVENYDVNATSKKYLSEYNKLLSNNLR